MHLQFSVSTVLCIHSSAAYSLSVLFGWKEGYFSYFSGVHMVTYRLSPSSIDSRILKDLIITSWWCSTISLLFFKSFCLFY